MPGTVRVLLVDDHALFRQALRMSLDTTPGLLVVGEAANGPAALAMFEKTRPDIVCMDLNLPGQSGTEITRQLLALHPDALVIGLSAHDDQGDIASLFKAGAMGYVSKMNAGQELGDAIRCAGLNQRYLSPTMGLPDIAGLT